MLETIELSPDRLLRWPRALLRLTLLLPALFLCGSAAPAQPSSRDILSALNQTGETMATLNDWRAILLVALVLAGLMLIGLLSVVFMSFRTITSLSGAMGGVRDAIQSNTLALARLETELGGAQRGRRET